MSRRSPFTERFLALSPDLLAAATPEGVLTWINPACEAPYRALVENLPDAVVVLFDGDLRMVVVEGKGLDRMVTSYLQLLERRAGAALDPDALEYLRFALKGAQQMRELIDDLLAYSRVGLAERTVEPVDTSKLVARVTATLTAGLDGAPPAIACGPLPEVSGDRRQLGQLFQNLIGNALKFVPPDRTPHVQVSAEPHGPGWRFSVRDNGIGIDPGDSERIFRMFSRLHGRDEYPGTGVGLAIARKVVERHGGRIWTERAPDCGTVFSFTIAE